MQMWFYLIAAKQATSTEKKEGRTNSLLIPEPSFWEPSPLHSVIHLSHALTSVQAWREVLMPPQNINQTGRERGLGVPLNEFLVFFLFCFFDRYHSVKYVFIAWKLGLKVVVMRQVKISRAGYQQSSAKPSSFIPQAWSNVFCREFPIMSSWGDECDCVRGLCLYACVCPVCDWSSSRLFSSVQYALRYAEMRHKYGWIKRSTLSNPAFTMESLITHGCVLGVCVSEMVRFEIRSVSLHVYLFIAHWSGRG